MSVNAVVSEGKIVETASQNSVSGASSAPNGYDKDAFLQLLVAQMKYQDPLEPTSNTEYISQYATFSQVEQLQNMAGSMDLSRASSMVGQTVQVSSTDAKGNTTSVEGVVDYVKYENGKAFVSIGGELYSSADVTAVIDGEYNTAFELAEAFANSMNSLPNMANLTIADASTIETLRSGYNSLSPYQQSFIDESYVKLLEQYVERMNEIKAEFEEYEASKKNAEENVTNEEENKENAVSEEAIDALLSDTQVE